MTTKKDCYKVFATFDNENFKLNRSSLVDTICDNLQDNDDDMRHLVDTLHRMQGVSPYVRTWEGWNKRCATIRFRTVKKVYDFIQNGTNNNDVHAHPRPVEQNMRANTTSKYEPHNVSRNEKRLIDSCKGEAKRMIHVNDVEDNKSRSVVGSQVDGRSVVGSQVGARSVVDSQVGARSVVDSQVGARSVVGSQVGAYKGNMDRFESNSHVGQISVVGLDNIQKDEVHEKDIECHDDLYAGINDNDDNENSSRSESVVQSEVCTQVDCENHTSSTNTPCAYEDENAGNRRTSDAADATDKCIHLEFISCLKKYLQEKNIGGICQNTSLHDCHVWYEMCLKQLKQNYTTGTTRHEEYMKLRAMVDMEYWSYRLEHFT